MRMLRYIAIASLWILVYCAASAPAQAQKIFAVLAADTTDGSIGPGIVANLSNIKGFLEVVHSLTNLDVNTVEISGDNFGCNAISDALDGVQASANDVILFYYSGHGFRQNSDQTQFPEFYCIRSRQDKELDLSNAVIHLQKKKPRLIFAAADTCNVPVSPQAVPAAAGLPPSEQMRKSGLLQLFVNYSGTLTMSGAKPGEYSWYMTSGAGLGGFFTNQLLRVINNEINDKGGQSRWEDIDRDAAAPILVPDVGQHHVQEPQYAADHLVMTKASTEP